jgi:Fur family transcriptional regulator, peroxide stress response regulator
MNKENEMKTETYRNTRQRTRLLEELCNTDTHPTASWLYDKLKPEFPSLSLGTVYRNLGILEEQGLLKKIVFGSTFDRFDGRTFPHTHFICKECNSVYDMSEQDTEEIIDCVRKKTKHLIHDVVMNYYGVCEKCLKEKAN